MIQWQCPTCNQWVDMTRPKHIHRVIENSLPVAEMVRLRELGQDALALETVGGIVETSWQPEYLRRIKPDE